MNSKVNIGYIFFLATVAATGGFLFGYDTAVISGTISPVTAQFSLNTLHQGWYVGCALLGTIIGVLSAGYLGDNIGRKPTLLVSAFLFFISSIGCAIALNFDQLVVYRIIGGVGIGVASIISPLYISEISIPQYRGRLVGLYQLAVTVGFLSAYLMNYALLRFAAGSISSEFSNPLMHKLFNQEVWRSMLGISALPSSIYCIIILFIPESPRWLLLKGRELKAQNIFNKILGSIEAGLQEIDSIKRIIGNEGRVGWKELLKPSVRKVIGIGAAIAILGQFMGVNAVLYYGPFIFEKSGLSGDDSLFYQVIIGMVNVATTILAIFFIDKIGRKKLIYYGVSGMLVSLVSIALFFWLGLNNGASPILLLISFLLYIFFCAGSISAVIFVLLSEMYPTNIRALAMSIAGVSLWIGTYLIGQLTPWLLENLTSAGTFGLFAVMCFPYLFIVWNFLPETAGKSLEEIETHWNFH